MGVEFHPEFRPGDVTGAVIVCYDDPGHGTQTFDDVASAQRAYETGIAAATLDVSCCMVDLDTPMVQASWANAAVLLDALGFTDADTGEVAMCGSADPADLRGRILIARALASDVGVPAHVSHGERGATFVDCGRPAGYLDAKFAELDMLAAHCADKGRRVAWS